MADRWMDERDREMRDRDWRRSERYGRGDGRYGEGRSWDDGDEGRSYGGSSSGGRDRVFGERESGANYGGPRYGRFEGGYGQGSSVGRGAMRGRDGQEDTAWQRKDYGGVSPAMEHNEYEMERGARRRGGGRSMGGRGYEGGGRFYGDDGREGVYRQEYGQGGVEYGREPRGYDAEREDRRRDHRRGRFAEDYEYSVFSGPMASGGTGGYDYERGYGQGPQQDFSRGRYYGYDNDGARGEREDSGGRSDVERGAHDAGDFFRRAGERVASWFGGNDGDRGEGRQRGFRGMGPKDYQRPDERISEDAHERLTDDPWTDASMISISVSGGEVTLAGTVENREAKHRAERIVEDISGVKHVQNNLRVDEGNFFTSPSRGYGDSVLQAQMREARTQGADGQSGEATQGRAGKGRGAGSNLSS